MNKVLEIVYISYSELLYITYSDYKHNIQRHLPIRGI